MEILQLRYFLESAKNENFSLTAAQHYVPPSSVSSSIKKLEKELGCSLFEHLSNKIILNDNGKIFYEAVNAAFSTLDSAVVKLSKNDSALSGTIHILVRTERSLVTEKMIDFRKKYPQVVFHMTHNFASGDYLRYDMIIDESTDKYRGFTPKPIISECIKIAASKKNALLGKKLLLADLKNASFITMSEGSSLNRITKEFCIRAGFTPNIIIESDDPYYVRRYISEDFGIAFFPETSWEKDLNDSIAFLDVMDLEYTRMTYAYINNSKDSGSAVRRFFTEI